MQYFVSVIDEETGSATATEMAAIDAFNNRLQAEGHWVFAGGLGSPSTAVRKRALRHFGEMPSKPDL